MEHEKTSEVCVSTTFVAELVVGFGLVSQHMPHLVMVSPPLDEMDPPHSAVISSMDETVLVWMVGMETNLFVTNECSSP